MNGTVIQGPKMDDSLPAVRASSEAVSLRTRCAVPATAPPPSSSSQNLPTGIVLPSRLRFAALDKSGTSELYILLSERLGKFVRTGEFQQTARSLETQTQTQLLTITAYQKLRLRLRFQSCGLFAKTLHWLRTSA